MKSIRFAYEETIQLAPAEIIQRILDLTNWSDFEGYGFLPGIKIAELESKTPEIVGSRIKVTNTDGSSHVEEIAEWEPDRRLTLHFKELTPPVSRLATSFEETWEFEPDSGGTKVIRSFRLHAKSVLTWPLLWVVSILLKKAIARHLAQMRDDAVRC
jgi:hypothetical protein